MESNPYPFLSFCYLCFWCHYVRNYCLCQNHEDLLLYFLSRVFQIQLLHLGGWASLIAQLVKNLPAMQEIPVQFLGQEDPLEKGKATHKYSGLENSMDWSHKELHMNFTFTFRLIIHFVFTFVYNVRYGANFLFQHMDIQLSQHHLLKRLFFPPLKCCLSTLVKYQLTINVKIYFLSLNSIPLTYMTHFILTFPGEGNGNPLQYSCLENPMDRGAWQATVHGVTKSQT